MKPLCPGCLTNTTPDTGAASTLLPGTGGGGGSALRSATSRPAESLKATIAIVAVPDGFSATLTWPAEAGAIFATGYGPENDAPRCETEASSTAAPPGWR